MDYYRRKVTLQSQFQESKIQNYFKDTKVNVIQYGIK